MRLKSLGFATTAALLAGLSAPTFADDGAINNKSMSRTIQVPTFSQSVVNDHVPEAEHAFTDMMGFYVPAQAASGAPATDSTGASTGLIPYLNIDEEFVEELPVAKPLVNVFIYGPSIGVENTAFGHSFMDTYAAVSLDDGVTWKQTNLSESADLSSFNLDLDHNPSKEDPLPNDHTIELEDDGEVALHAPGYETPFASHCTECHGVALQGTSQAPSCYSCHDDEWDEDTPADLGPVITEAEWEDDTLEIEGESPVTRTRITIINAVSGEAIGTAWANRRGEFEFEAEFEDEDPPCVVAAQYTDDTGAIITGPAVSVIDEDTGEPIDVCVGHPIDLTEYPGGTYNVFHATAGNKTLVAWPSRFCSQGQPAYSLTSVNNEEDTTRLDAIVSFLQNGDADLGVPALPGFSMEDDLYLVDAFGVAGSQGSIDFADEGYPQAGVVPFGCVWTARGVLLPGDDPRTEDVTESSHMVWTKAERLTSGRRDPNRIEVMAVKDAGFVITWQEDPDGLRPGQGEGPGEGWSGAVAHPQTDVWYSFINWEYFDIVEASPDDTTTPINILDQDLTLTGRPQVFVPMAVPMRLTNNAKCTFVEDDQGVKSFPNLYCDYTLAEAYGLKNQCADTVTIQTGNENNPSTSEICVADTNGDGIADLPNRANTAATRPRLGLQGYDASDTDKSAWVIVAMEESKGLGKYFFEPDGLDGGGFDGYADPCEDDGTSTTCAEEIGKNQWYFSYDMGTPDTSAGVGLPNSLVSNLVYQGDLLNQPEVYWETGEFYGLMATAEMGAEGTSLYGDYDFEIVSTEIARRASLLVQSTTKAIESANGLMAIPSWKQGPMRQGGPADTMLRRIVMPEGYGGDTPPEEDCPIDENVDDATGPAVTQATFWTTSAGGRRLNVTVTGFDGDASTRVQLRNAVNLDLYGYPRFVDETGTSVTYNVNADTWPAIPCAIQVADWDVPSPAFGPWTVVDTSALPTGESCVGTIPAECLGTADCPIVVEAQQPAVTDALLFNRASDDRLTMVLTVEGLDGDDATPTVFRNAVTGEAYSGARFKTDEDGTERFWFNPVTLGVPCAIQAADSDGSPEYGPWIAVDTSAYPDLVCDGPIPEECTGAATGSAVALAAATPGIEVNPYAFENMACENWLFEDGSNPYYPKGVCLDSAINLSAVVPDTCIDDDTGEGVDCPTVDFTTSTFGIGDTNPILQGFEQGEGNTTRVLTWHQCPSDGVQSVGDITAVTCDATVAESNLQDQSWYNPLDISKGHRGFLDGDFVQFLYAWSPNWRLNAKGNDRYELYVRRSFDGGLTWTTTPTSFTASDGQTYGGDGTVTCETYRRSETGSGTDAEEPKVCYDFPAGGAEHARNVTQHRSMRITTLDPRYAPTKATIAEGCTDGLFLDNTVIDELWTCDDTSVDYDSDLRDPSRYFMVFETGDNSTVAVGEAEPLDLFYGRAEGFGDDYVVWTETDTASADPAVCYPNVDYGVEGLGVLVGSGFCNEFDNMNTGGDTHSSEANLESNPDGSKLYGVWGQWVFDESGEEIIESDAMARRIWWIDDYVSETESYTLPGTQQPAE